MHGLPITDHQSLMDFRSFINTSLHQHVLVAAPHIPQWIRSLQPKKHVLKIPKENYGPFLLAITASGQAGYCPVTGGAFFNIGKIVVDKEFKGAVFLACLVKNDTFMGGTFYILDVYSYNVVNVLQMPFPQRFAFSDYLLTTFSLPSRYSLKKAIQKHEMSAFQEYDSFTC